tara:strand:+ start:771 stop:1070 length:300 start_codon:yes stop_codon:yes gene_type:complete
MAKYTKKKGTKKTTTPKKKTMFKKIIKEIGKGIIPALPFGNVITEIQNNIREDGFTSPGVVNWPKMIMYIITGLIVLGRLLGVISNEDVMTLIDTLSNI